MYWGLRDYQTPPLIWGGDPDCAHEWGHEIRRHKGGPHGERGALRGGSRAVVAAQAAVKDIPSGAFCRCGAWRGQLGLEPTPELYVEHMVSIFQEVRRVLTKDGTLWLNIGDCYATGAGRVGEHPGGGEEGARWRGEASKHDLRKANRPDVNGRGEAQPTRKGSNRAQRGDGNSGVPYGPMTQPNRMPIAGLKPKDLVMMPARLALALQADDWWLRRDIIWCLSGGTWLYVRTQESGICLMTIKDLARLRGPVELWNGERWTPLLGMSKSKRRGDELELMLRSGERITCTPSHRFPAERVREDYREAGVFPAFDLRVGDKLVRCRLPEPDSPRDSVLDVDAAWLAGLYIAEGSRSGDTVQISGHAKEQARWERLQRIAAKFGGSATRTITGRTMNVRLYGRLLVAVIEELVTGRVAHDKGFSPVAWRYSNAFLAAMVEGYLAGDGHWDAKNNRWRLGFTRNYNLERDLRTACARLGYRLTLKLASVRYRGRSVPTFRGEMRMVRSGHHSERDPNEIIAIRRGRGRNMYDVGVEDEPHVYALASGILTHNSKPNPMPESVRDRPTTSHEYVFLLTKSKRYYYDAAAIAELLTTDPKENYPARAKITGRGQQEFAAVRGNDRDKSGGFPPRRSGNKQRDIPSGDDGRGIPNSHLGRGIPWEDNGAGRNARSVWTIATEPYPGAHFATFPKELARRCILAGSAPGDTVLDPFGGSGTVAAVAVGHGRSAIHIDLSPAYLELARQRVGPMLCEVG